jgi:glycosyltransferase involved in cell wall biosynthesis
MSQPRFSVVIPAYNEELYLPRLLDSLDIARNEYREGIESIEVIVSNNGSTDLTAAIAESRGCQVANVGKRSIAAARNGGAAIARGDILCFIDADSAVSTYTFDEIERAMSSGRFVAGATGIYPERLSIGVIATFFVFMLVVWLTGMDTGLIFCRRQDFDAVGGYDDGLLYAEDVKFLWALRNLGRTRGQKLARLTSVRALGSMRKFDIHGDWHYFVMATRTLWGFLTGQRTDREIAEEYWYRPER